MLADSRETVERFGGIFVEEVEKIAHRINEEEFDGQLQLLPFDEGDVEV